MSSAASAAVAPAASDDSASLLSLATEYVRWEEDASYRSLVQSWVASNNLQEIRAHFTPRIAFGTAGLRARMAPGYKHMNPLVILQTSQGFVKYIESQYASTLAEAKERGLVLGYDGRHNSRRYAEIVATVFLQEGFRVHLFSRMVGTPLVPFGLLHKKAIAGVVITASHNPKEDNGFKVYWTNGAQIIPPHDAGIAGSIRENLKPWHAQGESVAPLAFDASHPRLSDPFDEVTGAYFHRSGAEYCWRREQNSKLTQQDCPVTFTAMHGVGAPFTARAFEAFNLPAYIPTPQQIEADPEFPTVRFPNPEEGKGALKLAMETADRAGSKLILANDPDADRLAVAEKVGEDWLPLNGNQIALLLASWTFENYLSREKPTKEQLSKTCMCASTVSSAVLASMAKKEGFNFYPTLTGFKWMGNRACQAVSEGERFLFAFEVEIGFLVGDLSYDKDGIRTAAIFYEMYASLRAEGKTCVSRLAELYARYGYFNMNTSYFFCDASSGKMDAIFARLRNYPGTGSYPSAAGPHKIRSVRDVTRGFDSSHPQGLSSLPTDRSSQMLTFTFENGCSCTLRNSGTEPKLKYYIECRAEKSAEDAAALTKEMSKLIIDEFIQPVQNGLEAPKQ